MLTSLRHGGNNHTRSAMMMLPCRRHIQCFALNRISPTLLAPRTARFPMQIRRFRSLLCNIQSTEDATVNAGHIAAEDYGLAMIVPTDCTTERWSKSVFQILCHSSLIPILHSICCNYRATDIFTVLNRIPSIFLGFVSSNTR